MEQYWTSSLYQNMKGIFVWQLLRGNGIDGGWQIQTQWKITVILQPDSTTSSLNEIGRIDGAPDERIWSARFVEDRAYIVTFRQIDPLWTIDLSDPTNPKIMGELEVPGVSTYIHPLDENNILTIGIGPTDLETGLGLDWSNTQVSMFDVSNFTSPQLASVLSLSPVSSEDSNEWTWGWASYL